MAKLNPFDICSHLNEKTNLDSNEVIDSWNSWMINLALANHMQTVLWSNEMNRLYDLPKEMQYKFYITGIPKGKRFGKWPKKEGFDTELVSLVQNYFQLNSLRAQQYIALMSPDQIQWLKNAQGGK